MFILTWCNFNLCRGATYTKQVLKGNNLGSTLSEGLNIDLLKKLVRLSKRLNDECKPQVTI